MMIEQQHKISSKQITLLGVVSDQGRGLQQVPKQHFAKTTIFANFQ